MSSSDMVLLYHSFRLDDVYAGSSADHTRRLTCHAQLVIGDDITKPDSLYDKERVIVCGAMPATSCGERARFGLCGVS